MAQRIKRLTIDNVYDLIPTGGGSSTDYEDMTNKPKIEDVELVGNKSFTELGITAIDGDDLIRILT